MTTLRQDKARCGVCGEDNVFHVLNSTNSRGSADLDTRPPEMKRSTMWMWVQRCTGCGYCAAKVSEARPEAAMVVKRQAYKDQLNNPAYPELANSFLCQAMVDQASGEYAAAFWVAVNAAWACDDMDRPDQALICRQLAIELLGQVHEHGQQVSEQAGATTALRVDLLRRAGRFKEAMDVAEAWEAEDEEDVIDYILDFQCDLIENRDRGCHTIAEAYEVES
jgi:hypothetical protein